ncbi:hypothetical protein W97_07010 [Coniosporium apollinis CBS 100218]|uniref:Uncharacterized protein n=1 Tax=Coniosporium apollinis (strain CBS 100218) TaxID=1168221 RepID=R7Z1G7_CONA1|nr:uncharacterized protein W97_07010 [Coniosporium apollinis CBS 100218]EON67756.1 hypothetical protein W97_07010 [Coniosporium apollinis CBS 100218]
MPDGFDPFTRGQYTSSPLGSTLFVVLRSLDPLLQYVLLTTPLATPLLNLLRTSPIPAVAPPLALGLSAPRLILWAMSAGAAAKQIFWLLRISRETMTPSSAVLVSCGNYVFNSVNTLLFLAAATSAAGKAEFFTPPMLVGAAVYAAGILTETFSEMQRKAFKDDPANKGKLFTGGLFGLARHINYGGYILFRAGYAMFGGGWIAGAAVFAWFARDFAGRGIPMLDEYCSKRYGDAWKQYKKDVPYRMFPGLF